MDRREFLKTCSLALIGAVIPKTVLGETKDIVREKFEKALIGNEEIETKKIEVFTKKISEMKGSPLEMNGIYAKNSLKQFLGINQYEEIFQKYNSETTKYRKNGKINDDKNSYIDNELIIPRIYDELTEYFPNSIEKFIEENPEQKENIGIDKTFLIVTKIGNGKFALAYYKDSKLFLATHISPGKISKGSKKKVVDKKTGEVKIKKIPPGIETREGVFRISKRDSEFRFKRSGPFEKSPMPYSIQVDGGIFLHHGQDVNGNKQSHGCIRVPGFYQEELYKYLISGTKIIVKGTVTKKPKNH